MIRFLLNDRLVVVEDIAADTTVLDYLRGNTETRTTSHEQRTGTKEGCCSGDCGACTVVVGEPEGDQLKYKTMNACIALMPSLHGKQLLTVEDLAGSHQAGQHNKKPELHPVQQALVDHHGSQCGFCTPGIVMSLFALYQEIAADHERTESKPDVLEALGGNLCRCTGYRPLIDAANSLDNAQPDDEFFRNREQTLSELQTIEQQGSVNTNGAFIPVNEDELASYLVDHPDARILAGGTDLGLDVTQQLKHLDKLVSVKNIPSLQTIYEDGHHDGNSELVIGSAVTFRSIKSIFTRYYPEFAHMLDRLGSQQIRNQGTLGGNIGNASPIGDTPPVLLALDASLDLRRGDTVRNIPLDRFFLDYKKTELKSGEYIARIRIPKDRHQLKVYKLSKRYGDDISTVLAAINLQTNDDGQITKARVALGGMAAIPRRARLCEQVLTGSQLNDETLRQAKAAIRQEFKPMSDVRASSEYRLEAAGNLLERYFMELSGQKVRIICHA
ncbi:xanthine dehydrogenase small subunit [Endozoicomonas sp. SCSIO W0465]|uniref:xanthine dehydrogenase small subunit n=1 Tax=Endozoicomonas sp. SCSIO W0465 TaxID=2918516 RepID=UPI002075112F|nr:xanthine dehydrogenase small subunit [Endozoicomonas sp. SCSIO W0465]USE35822.1 xanthine dehydrogenase small subunit [Endozoicomonas sp. SCSIO W0465]